MKKNHLFKLFGIFIFVLFNSFIVNAASFPDVSEDYQYSEAIDYVKTNNIVSGYPNGNFQPEQTINRAEFTKIIISAQFSAIVIDQCISENIQQDEEVVLFPDIPKDTWFAKYVCIAKTHNIISGYPDGTFRPADTINFAETAKIFSNAFDYPVSPDATWYKPFVENLAAKNAIPTTIIDFDYRVQRGEMAEMIYRLKSDVSTKVSWDYETLNNMMTLSVSFQTSKDNENFIDCGKTDVVTRVIPYTSATATAALTQLFKGPTADERLNGMQDFLITEETAQNLNRVFIQNGIAYLDWQDIRQLIPSASASCGSASFLSPIEATLMQFPSVTKVIHAINGEPQIFYNWIQMGCSSENNNCDARPYQITQFPTTCVDTVEGIPVITSLSTSSGTVGTSFDIQGCNFSGFEGDLHAWIENSEGVKGILYSGSGSTSKLLHVTIKSPLCQTDTSYSGLSCDEQLFLSPGQYQIYVMPWGKMSNKVDFTII